MEIRLEQVTKKIRGITVLNDISYTFTGGKIYGLSGKNGCGKTMLMRLISGLIYATEGKVIINNQVLGKDITFPTSMGLLIENPAFLRWYTGYENLEILSRLQGGISKEDIANVMMRVGLQADDRRKYYKYSLGMRQRLGIAAAIMGYPDIVLLDEPINAIDSEGVSIIRECIRSMVAPERIIIVACHDKEEMKYLADEVLYIKEGSIWQVESAEGQLNR